MTNNLAIIAAGAMGSAIARRMAENGARELISLNGILGTRFKYLETAGWRAHTG
jgi:pyrroline-5-carboxylate reductase